MHIGAKDSVLKAAQQRAIDKGQHTQLAEDALLKLGTNSIKKVTEEQAMLKMQTSGEIDKASDAGDSDNSEFGIASSKPKRGRPKRRKTTHANTQNTPSEKSGAGSSQDVPNVQVTFDQLASSVTELQDSLLLGNRRRDRSVSKAVTRLEQFGSPGQDHLNATSSVAAIANAAFGQPKLSTAEEKSEEMRAALNNTDGVKVASIWGLGNDSSNLSKVVPSCMTHSCPQLDKQFVQWLSVMTNSLSIKLIVRLFVCLVETNSCPQTSIETT